MNEKGLKFKIKRFEKLLIQELYDVLRLRSEVFIVEQNCVYQDIDNKDQKALHLIGYFEGKCVAYARLFAPGDYFEKASIGRVVVKEIYRKHKWGHELMKKAIDSIEKQYDTHEIIISAQHYLSRFYESHGFITISEPYLEDGIPHVQMYRARGEDSLQ